MMMTKQHFVALAQALASRRPANPAEFVDYLHQREAMRSQWAGDVERIADVCAASNAQFKRAAFYDACGYTAAYGRT